MWFALNVIPPSNVEWGIKKNWITADTPNKQLKQNKLRPHNLFKNWNYYAEVSNTRPSNRHDLAHTGENQQLISSEKDPQERTVHRDGDCYQGIKSIQPSHPLPNDHKKEMSRLYQSFGSLIIMIIASSRHCSDVLRKRWQTDLDGIDAYILIWLPFFNC